MDINEILHKEIDLIQNCINRMAQNSFLVKGWLITLLTVVIALLPETINIKILCAIGFVVVMCFWYLDAFFLKTERLYRWKYEWIISNRQTSNANLYDLNPYNKGMWINQEGAKVKEEPKIVCVMLSKTLTPMYLPLIVIVIFLFVNSFKNWI
jgi:hypothetical protein